MSSPNLEHFVQAVVDDHGLATGIKSLSTHYDIVAYANIRGHAISLTEWGRYIAMDMLQATDAELELLHRADPSHWSWAFRQLSRWRSILMDGAGVEGLLGPADFAVSPPPATGSGGATGATSSKVLSDAEKDQALQAFITLVRTRADLKDQVKFARNQDEVIAIAKAQGFEIDSLTLLRSWSQVSDFSKPTWFGWFDD